MKKIVVASFAILTLSLNAQITVPKASPAGKIEQRVGLADLSISYNRPAKRDRVVFGDVVPYGEVWRFGANETTNLTTNQHLIFGKDTLKLGSYAIYIKPTKENWDIIFYKETTNWGLPEVWDETKVALRTIAPVIALSDVVENLTINFDNIQNSGATLQITWDKTKINLPFTLNTKDKVMTSIKKTMDGATANDYNQAANYYFTEKVDMKQALVWSAKAVEMRPEAYWMSRLKAQIQAANGDFKGAIETAKLSILAAEKDGDQNYVKMNKVSIEEWSKKK